jgi:transcriptional regulator with GAF, ATPase, and Fis domain
MMTVNCGAIPRQLVESELFGHRRGAFTGALEHRRGAFESADGGTLFLDEIGELPLDVQPALLRALESGEIRSVGEDKAKHVKVRVVAATNRDLAAEVSAGRFREDLFFRLAVVRINVPPLRGRPEDIELLANDFAGSLGIAPLPDELLEELKSRSWRGNARELRNAVQAYAAVGQLPADLGGPVASLEEALRTNIDASRPYAEQKDAVLDQFTRVYLKMLIQRAQGNQSAAARIAGLDRTYLGRLLVKYGLVGRRHSEG